MMVGMSRMAFADEDAPDEIPGVGPEVKDSPNNPETEHETERLRPVYDRQENSNMCGREIAPIYFLGG